ncbi:MAG: exo-alpha-sialidase, partial [Acidobacteriota bacterium]|nr:exo-alpha-sialidase [Acidobacteriota bacterium]
MNRTIGSALGVAAAVAVGGTLAAWAQSAAPAASASEEYLLLGDATRGAGEPMIAVDPTNPKNIVAVAMGNLQRVGDAPATANMTDAYHAAANSTITWLGVTHDGGIHWKIGELPILSGGYTRCPDSFVSVTADGTFLAGCEPRETTGEFFGTSALVISTDKGDTWSKAVDLISSYGAKRFAAGLKPRIGGNSPWDRPFLYIDDSDGTVYAQAGGGETDVDQEPGHYRTQSYLTASTDHGRSFGTIYAWDSKEYPQMGRGRMTAGHGVVAVAYVARSAPGAGSAACPCVVMGVSRDHGASFSYHVLPAMPAPPAAPRGGRGPGGGPGNGGVAGLAADPSRAGRIAIMTGSATEYRVAMSEDYGQTWSGFVSAGRTPGA